MPRRTLRGDGNDRRPLRPPLSPATLVLQRWAASRLVGEWAPSGRPRSTDTTLLRFGPDGSAEQLQLGPGHEPREIPFGPFRVYADTGRMRLLCFSLRRGRSQPACRYFQVDTLDRRVGTRPPTAALPRLDR